MRELTHIHINTHTNTHTHTHHVPSEVSKPSQAEKWTSQENTLNITHAVREIERVRGILLPWGLNWIKLRWPVPKSKILSLLRLNRVALHGMTALWGQGSQCEVSEGVRV